MSSPPTFFLPPELWDPPYILKGKEHHHLSKVLKLRPGANIQLLDGQGKTGLFSISRIDRLETKLDLLSSVHQERPAPKCHLALGWNKSIRRSWFFEKAAELGAAGIHFWQAERSQGKIPKHCKESWLDQLTAGAKQSQNSWLPEVSLLSNGLQELIETFERIPSKICLWEGEQTDRLRSDPLKKDHTHLFVIGPEGGLTQNEVETLAQQGYRTMSLGKRVLRWETAALVCLGAISLVEDCPCMNNVI